MAWDPPPSAQNIPIRPLQKGVDRSTPPQMLPMGGFRALENILVSRLGLSRRGAFDLPAPIDPFPYDVYRIADCFANDGRHLTVALTSGTLHEYNFGGTVTDVGYVLASGTSLVVSGTTVTSTGATWLSSGATGLDLVRVTGYEASIETVVSDTEILLASADIPDGTYATYEIVATFATAPQVLPDWTAFEGAVLTVDTKHEILAWDALTETVAPWIDTAGKYPPGLTTMIPTTILAADGRIWVGNTYDDVDGYQRQRIRWSGLADPRDFNFATNFLDFPYEGGTLVKLALLGTVIVAYMTNGIYLGSLTNFPLLPRRFDRVETGGIGLVGPCAVAAWSNLHFFVGQDNIYVLSPQGELEAVGTPIIADVLSRCGSPEYIYAVSDPENSQLVFGFPGSGQNIEELWFYNLVTKAWSSGVTSSTMLSVIPVDAKGTWALETRTWAELIGTGITWVSDQGKLGSAKLAIARDYHVLLNTPDADEDYDGIPIPVTIETGDIDFGAPDEIKVVVRLNARILRTTTAAAALAFNVEGSTNGGARWKRLGVLRIAADASEGAVMFAQTGSSHRFRLTAAAVTPVFAITELGLRVRGGGAELSFGTQNG